MKKIIVISVLLFPLSCLGQDIKQSVSLGEKIFENLELIENMYISELDLTERRKAKKLMDETKDLIQILIEGENYHPADSYLLSEEAFMAMLTGVEDEINESNKTDLILSLAPEGRILCSQFKELLETYAFDGNKAECIKQMYPFIADKENIIIVLQVIDSDIKREELIEFIKKSGRKD